MIDTVKIIKCTCAHAFQDEEYGDKQRVASLCKTKTDHPAYRCTVCTKEYPAKPVQGRK